MVLRSFDKRLIYHQITRLRNASSSMNWDIACMEIDANFGIRKNRLATRPAPILVLAWPQLGNLLRRIPLREDCQFSLTLKSEGL
jgi:hypothetical protein